MTTKYFMNGGVDSNWSTNGNWSTTASTGPANTTKAVNGDVAILNAGSPNCIIDVSSACTTLDCTGYTHTLTFTSNMSLQNLTYGSGMTVAGTGTVTSTGFGTLTSGGKIHTGGITLGGSSATHTFSGTWVITGLLSGSAGGTSTISGSSLSVGGGLSVGSSAINGSAITLTGGTWTGISGGYVTAPLTLAGNITISGTVGCDGTLTYSSGTITTTGSTVEFANAVTINAAAVTFNNVYFPSNGWTATLSGNLNCTGNASFVAPIINGPGELFAATASFGAGTNTITLGTNINISGLSSWTNASNGTTLGINTSTSKKWNTGGLNVNSGNTSTLAGTATLVFNSTGTWQSGASNTVTIPITINTAGTLTISGTVVYSTGTITYTAGTVVTTGSQINFTGNTTVNTPNMLWYDIAPVGAGMTLTINAQLLCRRMYTFDVNVTFAGSAGFTCTGVGSGLLDATSITASRTFTFAAGKTYNLGGTFRMKHSVASTVRYTFTAASTCYFILPSNATQDVGFCDPTNIDASQGQKIFTFRGTITNSPNWTNTAPISAGILAAGNS